MMDKLKVWIKLLRVEHYIKNLLIWIPFIFAEDKTLTNFILVLKGMIIFCCASSIVYIVNDLKDISYDLEHPIKKNRPIPSGKVKKSEAILAVIILCIFMLLGITTQINKVINIIPVVYIVINYGYSIGLKNQPIIDLAILSFGFVLRVIYGGGGN